MDQCCFFFLESCDLVARPTEPDPTEAKALNVTSKRRARYTCDCGAGFMSAKAFIIHLRVFTTHSRKHLRKRLKKRSSVSVARIRELLEHDHLNYTEAAERLGISRWSVSCIASQLGIRKASRYQCGCGMVLKMRASHRRGAIHRYGPRIRILLEQDCLSFAGIGKRLRITRERVRQIARLLDSKSGRQRQDSCRVKRSAQAEPQHVKELQFIAKDRGLSFERIISMYYNFLTRRVKLSGHVCAIALASNRRGKIHIPARKGDYDFFLGKTAFGWLVIPREKLPRHETTVLLGRAKPTPGARVHRHDWHVYLNAWRLL